METIRAGETLVLELSPLDAASVVGTAVGTSSYSLTSESISGGFKLSADTTSWTPGEFLIGVMATKSDGTKYVAHESRIKILAPFSALVGTDTRSIAAKIVDKIEAYLSGSTDLSVKKYKINNRELERIPHGELLQILSQWKRTLRREEAAASGRSILGPRIAVRC